MGHLIWTGALCAILSSAFPHCRDERPIASTGDLPQYRLNTAALADELCAWTRRGRVCVHGVACSPAEYAKGRCL
jgi:hypothetical protein